MAQLGPPAVYGNSGLLRGHDMNGKESFAVAHSSDLHLNREESSLQVLDRVLRASEGIGARVLVLAGDVFDDNRLPLSLLDRVSRALASAKVRIVILPGNHDCLTVDSVYVRGSLGDVPNVHVLGVTDHEAAVFSDLDLEVWGRPHVDYADMRPLRHPRPRSTRWQIAMAHGHWVSRPSDMSRAWLIRDEEIAATQADYVALGHWEAAVRAGSGLVPAHYSGSPSRVGSINVVRFSSGEPVHVFRVKLPPA